MLKSMTAYSRSILTHSFGRFNLEIQSINRKFLEINTLLPKALVRFDSEIKKQISEKIHRGQINVRLDVAFDQGAAIQVVPNLTLATQLKSAWDQIATHIGIANAEFPLSLLSQEKGILTLEEDIQDEEQIKKVLQNLIGEGIVQLLEMKNREGQALQADIVKRLDQLQQLIDAIERKAPDAIQKYKDKLFKKIQEVIEKSSLMETDERLLKEICLFAEKVDIAEEITRFNSHLMQFRYVLDSNQQAVGKTLEFIVQELNREINTIGSKSADAAIAHYVIDAKTELERIREQIQNVE